MPILRQEDQETVRRRFETELKRGVKITLVTQRDIGIYVPGRECKTCGPTQGLLEDVCALSDKVDLEVVDFYGSPQDVQSRGVDKIPAILVGSDGNENARYYGLPSGYEFALLIDSIVNASTKISPLQLETRRQLKRLEDDVHIQVFVTPT